MTQGSAAGLPLIRHRKYPLNSREARVALNPAEVSAASALPGSPGAQAVTTPPPSDL